MFYLRILTNYFATVTFGWLDSSFFEFALLRKKHIIYSGTTKTKRMMLIQNRLGAYKVYYIVILTGRATFKTSDIPAKLDNWLSSESH